MNPKDEPEFLNSLDWTVHTGEGWTLYTSNSVRLSGKNDLETLVEWFEENSQRWRRSGAGRGRRNTVVQSPVIDEDWFLKQYHHGGLLAGDEDVDYADPDRFFNELRATLRAEKAGVKTPAARALFVRNVEGGYRGFYASRYLEKTRPFSRTLRLEGDPEYLRKAGEALAFLHDAEIDHRDYHVGNLLVDSDGEIVVCDFDPVQLGTVSTFKRGLRVNRFGRSLRKYGFLREDVQAFNDAYRDATETDPTLIMTVTRPFTSFNNTLSDLIYWGQDRGIEPVNLEKILVRAPNWLGDTVMSLPLLQRLRSHDDVGRIDVAVRSSLSDVYRAHDSVNRVWELSDEKSMSLPDDVREERYSSIVVIPKSFRTGVQAFRSGIPRRIGFATQGRSLFLTDRVPLRGRDRSEHHARLYARLLSDVLDPSEAIPPPAINPDPEEMSRIREAFDEPFFTTHPGSAYGPAKRWPPEYFSEALKQLLDRRDEYIVALGVEEEEPIAEEIFGELPGDRIINKVGKTTLKEAMAYLSLSRGTIANDSGIMHLSAGLGTPTLGIFGSSDPGLTRPLGPSTSVLYRNVDCSPCFERECPLDSDRYKCLRRIEPDQVRSAFLELVENG